MPDFRCGKLILLPGLIQLNRASPAVVAIYSRLKAASISVAFRNCFIKEKPPLKKERLNFLRNF